MKICEGLFGFLWTSMSANNCNTYLIDGPARVLIDPGHLHLFDHVSLSLRRLGLKIADMDLVIATHAHPDHFEAVRLFRDHSVPFALSLDDWRMLEEVVRHMGPAFDLDAYTPDLFLREGSLEVKGIELRVIRAPGHSPGSVSLYWPERKALFSGDTLFRDGLGRTDLPGGSGESLKESIRSLEALDVEWLLPGHGEIVSGAERVKANFKRVEESWFGYI